MRSEAGGAVYAILALGLALSGAPVRADQEAPGPSSSATLPLDEVLRLHREAERASRPVAPPAPIAAAVTELKLTGRLLEDAVELEAHFESAVLGEPGWIKLALLGLGDDTHLSSLPRVAGGEFVVDRAGLWFVTDRAGRYAFDLKLVQAAKADGPRRRASLAIANASLALLTVRWDEGLFRLHGGRALTGTEGAVLFPKDGRFDIQWEQLGHGAEGRAPEQAKRPPIESVITQAHASCVATLEGLQITRVNYRLRFEGSKPISFQLPEGHTLVKVYLNGAAVPFALENGALSLTVSPPRAGDQAARLELVLERRGQGFHLSGRLAFAYPAASWSVDELFAELHLPQVFNYRWMGGSLAPFELAPETDFAHRIPTPGKRLRFHQQLIGSAPDVQVAYAVDLAGQVFRASADSPRAAAEPGQAAGRAQADHSDPAPEWSDAAP